MSVIKNLAGSDFLFKRLKGMQESYLPARRRAVSERVKFYRQFVGPGDLVFDVGANMGNRVQAFLELGCRVVAVEPQPKCLSVLNHRFGRLAEFTSLNLALGAQSGVDTMNVSSSHVLSSLSSEFASIDRFGETWIDEIAVRVSTLGELVKVFGDPSFVKIDVEGFEPEVLQGLKTPLRALSIEHNSDLAHHTVACIEKMSELSSNYEWRYSKGESMMWTSPWLDFQGAVRVARDQLGFGDFYARDFRCRDVPGAS